VIVEAARENPDADRLCNSPDAALVSGSSKSKIVWDTLSREGRRCVSTVTNPEDIKRNVKTAQQPIRLCVGLDSAQSEEERVNLAFAELARTKAYELEFIVGASPTGTSCLVGQPHYAMACPLAINASGIVSSALTKQK